MFVNGDQVYPLVSLIFLGYYRSIRDFISGVFNTPWGKQNWIWSKSLIYQVFYGIFFSCFLGYNGKAFVFLG